MDEPVYYEERVVVILQSTLRLIRVTKLVEKLQSLLVEPHLLKLF